MTTVNGLIGNRWPLQLTDDRAAFHAARGGKWEIGRLEHMAELVRPGMVVYDIGAESGDFTALYKSWVGPSGTVIPVEPQPAYWPSIRATWEANFDLPLLGWFPGFAGSTTTIAAYDEYLKGCGWDGVLSDPWPSSSTGPIIPDVGFYHLAYAADRYPTVRLDALADILALPPDAVTIDVEGAEYEVLAGMELLLLGPHRPLVWVSVHDNPESNPLSEWYHRTRDDLHLLMDSFGYDWLDLPDNGEIERFVAYLPR